ncbi:type II toxin-antitoxin system RelE/ParE family toxin [Lyngbya sp. CCY1209]|jgi:mRNA interferase RelE/StbE|uniref:type II toxin-antitoxin system RelE family toxin n=1 Tax=Lyngbya sp. CCY1209 TaxID=2886103 RepID=UPI002D200B6A|nr:type II toxin-antitoxin system RelE/ParE family toxin [Lyngbya sp. CCY1209]
MYKVLLTRKAEKFYSSANRPLARKIARCLEVLEQTPRSHPNIKSLKGSLSGRYRYRIGDYRVIYQIDDDKNKVIVSLIVHRGEAYQ